MKIARISESEASINVDPREICSLRIGLRAAIRNLEVEKTLPDQDQLGISIAKKKMEEMLTSLSKVVLHY
jgi:hypothetical protein